MSEPRLVFSSAATRLPHGFGRMGDDNRQPHEAPEQVSDLPHHGERDGSRWIDCKQWRRSTRHGFVHADAKRHELEHHRNDAVERLEGDCLRSVGL